MPAAPRGLPTIFLGETPKLERELPPVYLCETSHDGASSRLKWMASTCLAGMVGVCLIGVAIYASMNMADGSGMVSSIKRASLAALQPIRSARLAHDAQSAYGPERGSHPADLRGLRQPPSHSRHGGRASRQPRVHHHQALLAHRREPGHGPPRRCRRAFRPSIPSSSIPTPRRSAAATPRPTPRNPSSSTWSTCRAAFCRRTIMSSSPPTR